VFRVVVAKLGFVEFVVFVGLVDEEDEGGNDAPNNVPRASLNSAHILNVM
jgi:hypothetical protein